MHFLYFTAFVNTRAMKCKAINLSHLLFCERPWPLPAANIMFIHKIQVLTEPLCHAQAIFYSLPNNEWGTKYRGLTYSAK